MPRAGCVSFGTRENGNNWLGTGVIIVDTVQPGGSLGMESGVRCAGGQ
jgi:hypothetical protein